jgi:hypothetical protein
MGSQLTIRGVSPELAHRLKELARTRKESVNTTALRILEGAAGVSERRKRLARYATWTAADVKEFDVALASQRAIDEELWG